MTDDRPSSDGASDDWLAGATVGASSDPTPVGDVRIALADLGLSADDLAGGDNATALA